MRTLLLAAAMLAVTTAPPQEMEASVRIRPNGRVLADGGARVVVQITCTEGAEVHHLGVSVTQGPVHMGGFQRHETTCTGKPQRIPLYTIFRDADERVAPGPATVRAYLQVTDEAHHRGAEDITTRTVRLRPPRS
jgi:hypothetical protein